MRIASLLLGLQAGLAVATVPESVAGYHNQNPIISPHIPQGNDRSGPTPRKNEFVSLFLSLDEGFH